MKRSCLTLVLWLVLTCAATARAEELIELDIDVHTADSGELIQLVEGQNATISVVSSPFMIGIMGESLSDTLKAQLKLEHGVVVTQVMPNTPASKAGLQAHDIILSIGDKPVSGIRDFFAPLKESNGSEVTLKLVRAGEEQTIRVQPKEREEQRQASEERGHRLELRNGFTVLNPAIILEGVEAGQHGDAQRHVRIEMKKDGDGPGQIKIEANGKTYETTVDKLDELPVEIRELLKIGHRPEMMRLNLHDLVPAQAEEEIKVHIGRLEDLTARGGLHANWTQVRESQADEDEDETESLRAEMKEVKDELLELRKLIEQRLGDQ